MSISEIERRTGLTRKTISKWLNAPERTEPKYQRRIVEDTKIATFTAQLTKALEVDSHCPKRNRRKGLTAITAASLSLYADGERLVGKRWSRRLCRCGLNLGKRSSLTGAKSDCSLVGYGILVAVELVLESGNPSAEHVENVLNRLKAVTPPQSVKTHLEVSEEPIADAGRYDSLRTEVDHA